MSGLDTIKRQARKEAWYGDSYNPFKKNMRSNTWAGAGQNPRDIEANLRNPRESTGEPLSASQTEPPYHFPEGSGRPSSKDNEMHMTSARTTTNSRGDKVRATSSEETGDTAVEAPTSSQDEGKPRQRFGFLKHEKDAEDDDKPKKRPWYKGKELKHKPYTVRNQLEATIFNSWINILLLAAPVGIAINYAGVSGTIVFVVNFIAIIPLAAMLSFATEEIALHVGESLGGLLNASFGNAVELIVAIIALAKDEITVVQTSLVGSILSNLLLVMGMCFFFGGLRRTEQHFNQTVAETAASLLALAVGSLIIPTCFDLLIPSNDASTNAHIASLSRGTAVILLVVYISFLYFQLSTHKEKFNIESQKVAMRPRKHAVPEGALAKGIAKVGGMGAGAGRPQLEDRPPNDELINRNAFEDNAEDEEPEEPQLHIAVAWATLAGATAIIGLCAEFMVDGIGSITKDGVSVEFVGLILLPIVGNAAEHATAVTVACKDKMDLAIGVAVGSSMQIALGVIPLSVVIGWIMGKEDMTLAFDGFQVVLLFVAILLVNYLISDGKSNYLEGLMLQCLYLIIATCAWFYPAKDAV